MIMYSINPKLARFGIIYPVHFIRRENVLSHLAEIQTVERLSSVDLKYYQLIKLNKLLQFYSQRETAYKHLWEKLHIYFLKMDVSAILMHLPILTKEAIRNIETLKQHRFGVQLDRRSTSGSTGSPFCFYKDRLSTSYMEAIQNYAYSWHGVAVGEPQGRFWGLPYGMAGKMARIKDFLKNRIRFSAFNLTDEAKTSFWKQLLQFRPTYLYGYPSLILEFARFVREKGYAWDELQLKVAIGTGEYTYPQEKMELEELLGVPFVSEYGCSETGVIGFECPHGRMHVMAANIILEVVDEQNQPVEVGAEGELIVTELNARYFPFIRYRLGDRGCLTEERCACGRGLPVMRICEGRRDDYIVTPEGRKVYDAILAYNLKKGILQFKAVQEEIGQLRIFFRSDGQFTKSLENEYIRCLKKAISPLMEFTFIQVDEIRRERSGKLRYFCSKIGGEE